MKEKLIDWISMALHKSMVIAINISSSYTYHSVILCYRFGLQTRLWGAVLENNRNYFVGVRVNQFDKSL